MKAKFKDQTEQLVQEVEDEHSQWMEALREFFDTAKSKSEISKNSKITKIMALQEKLTSEQKKLKFEKIQKLINHVR